MKNISTYNCRFSSAYGGRSRFPNGRYAHTAA